MSFFYGRPTVQRFYGFVSYEDQDATEHYIKHYRNYLLLDFMSKNLEEMNDRAQALQELTHCERTLYRWKMHCNWDESIVLPVIEALKRKPINELIAELSSEVNGEENEE